MERSIVFTKLKTVKSKDFEYTYEDFFRLIIEAIKKNPLSSYIKYDEEKDSYVIIYNNKIYQLQKNDYSEEKDIKLMLQKLVDFTHKQREIFKQREEEKKALLEKQNLKKEELLAEKKLAKSRISSDISSINGLKSEIKDTLPGSRLVLYCLTFLAVFIFQFGIPIAPFVYLLVSGLSNASSTLSMLFMASIFWIPVGLVVNTIIRSIIWDSFKIDPWYISDFLESLRKRIKLKKELLSARIDLVKDVFKGIFHKKKKEKIRKPKNGEIIKGYYEEVEEKSEEKVSRPGEYSSKEIAKEFRDLKRKILEIKNPKWKQDYSSELLEIINYYKEASDTYEGKKGYLMVHSQVLNQIYSLRARVEQTIRDEKNREKTDNEFNAMLDEIDNVSKNSNGAKK